MKNAQRITALIALTLILLTANTVAATEGVSPGAPDRLASVGEVCPTFSWQEDDASKLYEIVAYSLPTDEDPADAELTAETEVLYSKVAAGATSWTPPADQCFARGGRYVWFVRSVTELIDDQIIEAGEWSVGRYFSVPAGPSAEDVARAVEVLKQWEAANSGGEASPSPAGTRSGGASPTLRRYRAGSARADAGSSHRKGEGEGEGHRKSVPTAAAAIRGEHPGTSGEVHGVVGTSASADGAGVAAANLDGGPDLVLDGSADGETDTVLWQGGVDRASASHQTFAMGNSGTGRLHLTVDGDMTANVVRTEEVVVNGLTVIDDVGDWLGNGSTVPCSNCVTSSDIVDGGVSSADIGSGEVTNNNLADGSVTAAKIRGFEVGTIHLADGSVTGDKIPGATITSAHIFDGEVGTGDLAALSVTGGKLANDSVTNAKIAGRSVYGSHIAIGTIGGYHIGDGEISTAELADDAVTSEKIDDGSVASSDLADDAVTGAKIADGSISYEHISLGAGNPIRVTKDQGYEVSNTEQVPAGEIRIVTASCDDGDDIPISGFCWPNGAVQLKGFTSDEYWRTDSVPAGFRCLGENTATDPRELTAKIYCVRKD